jgi:hypothetical protein
MGANRILIAFVVLAGLLAITVWQFNARDTEDRRPSDVKAELPKIKKEDVDELSFAAPNKKAVTLKKVGEKKWELTEPLKAQADATAVDNALGKLAELDVVAVAATKAENYEKLEVDDKQAVHVVAKQGGKVLADLLIGAYRSQNTMVRQKDAVNVAAVRGSIKYAFDKEVKDWREKQISDVTSEQVKQIEFDNPKGKYKFVFEDGAWKQAPGEKVLPNFESGKIVSLVGTATTMRAQDFAADEVTAEAAGVGAKPAGLVRLTTGGDAGVQEIVLRVGNKLPDGNNWYLKREDKEPIFVVSDFSGSRMTSGPDGFQKDAEKDAGAKDAKGAKAAAPGKAPALAHHP